MFKSNFKPYSGGFSWKKKKLREECKARRQDILTKKQTEGFWNQIAGCW